MSEFVISGFSDEIDSSTDIQFEHLTKLGIKYFEPRNIDGKNIADLTESELYSLKDKMDKFGMSASSIGSPIGKINITDEFEPHMKKLSQVIKAAKILNTKYIRIFSFYIPDGEKPETYKDEVMKRMRKMTDLAEKEDIILLHENEKGIYGDTAPRCVEIFENVRSSHLRGVFDPANFIQCGQKVYPDAYMMLKSYIVYFHVKDAEKSGRVVPAGAGDGNWEMLINELDRNGYRGFLSLEPHLGEFEGFDTLENGKHMKASGKSTAEKFTLAYKSLTNILEEANVPWKK